MEWLEQLDFRQCETATGLRRRCAVAGRMAEQKIEHERMDKTQLLMRSIRISPIVIEFHSKSAMQWKCKQAAMLANKLYVFLIKY